MAVSLHISLLVRSISYSRGSGVVPKSVKPANPYGRGKEIIAMNEWFPDELSIPSGGKRRPRVVLVEESCADAMSAFVKSQRAYNGLHGCLRSISKYQVRRSSGTEIEHGLRH